MRLTLAQKIRLMAEMKRHIAQPVRQHDLLRYERQQLASIEIIFKASTLPFSYNAIYIANKRALVAFPHMNSRVITPAKRKAKQRVEYLKTLRTLLAESLIIENRGRFVEARVGQESLDSYCPSGNLDGTGGPSYTHTRASSS